MSRIRNTFLGRLRLSPTASRAQNRPINLLLLIRQVGQRREDAGVAHRLRQPKDIAAKCNSHVSAVRFPHCVRPAHSRDASGDERAVQDQPAGVALHGPVRVALTREEWVFWLGRPQGRLDPLRESDCGPGMDDHGTAGTLTLAILAVQVKPRQHLPVLVHLAQLQAQQF